MNIMKKIFLTTLLLIFAISASLFSQQKYNSDVENVGADCPVTFPGTFNTLNSALPDPFKKLNGTRMTSWINRTTPSLSGELNIGGEPVSGFALSTSVSPTAGGSAIPNPAPPASGRYDEGATVMLTAAPATGWGFDGRSGDAAGAQSPLTVTMNANKNITAKFVPTADCTTNSITNGNFTGTALGANWTLNQGQYYGNSAATASVNGGKATINITTAGYTRHVTGSIVTRHV